MAAKASVPFAELMLPKTGGTEFRKPFDTDGGDESSRVADANMAAFDTTPKTDRRSV
jgi:hypothetical protein